jgi:hypothetical protein
MGDAQVSSNLPPGCTDKMIDELTYPEGYDKNLEELFGALDFNNNDDLPDGAWWQVLEDTVDFFNDANGTNYEPNEMVHQWVQSRGS